ncbi:mid1-interacting protein 1-like [Panonychus citri]|uniref:mid1-interacting protein 1-like n=1 Tax=Panonychus citri TaxID=50023 RepID=UPI00230757E5|nr:mid1-interacting protein 1-like [Panonychus citri]XP_053213832.1 mid1-interacting protein 1-like [Panonychus citri]
MDRFVKSVNNMNSTVLVPSKLRDMDIVGNKISSCTGSIPPCLANADMYSFYVMMNDVKEELLWGPSSISTFGGSFAPDGCCPTVRDKSINCTVGSNRLTTSLGSNMLTGGRITGRHSRQPSADESLGSLGSTASSSDLETDSEADSFVKDKELDDATLHLAQAFRQHLQALHTILHQFADAADYLSLRYQEEIDSSF